MIDLSGLPGGDLVQAGVIDLAHQHETVPALLVVIASRRLRRLGVPVHATNSEDAELRLYRALCVQNPKTAYALYNSLLRRLDSCAHALEREQAKDLAGRVSR